MVACVGAAVEEGGIRFYSNPIAEECAFFGFRNMNEQAQACLRKAEECEHSAQQTRLLYLDLANHWRTLAKRVEAMDRQRARLEQSETKTEGT